MLPSYSEGLSVSVLEAMALGLPVIVTRQCNLPEVDQHSCGLVINPDTKELTLALDNLLSASAAQRTALGANGQRLVNSRYSWQVVGEQMSSLYRWLEGGSKPAQFELLGAR